MQFQHGHLLAFHGSNLDLFGMVDQRPCNCFHKFLHEALPHSHSRDQLEYSLVWIPWACGILPERPRFKRAGTQAIFWAVRKLRTVSLGCAPHPNQYLMRSASNKMAAGFLSGS